MHKTHVIIPIYNAYEDLIECINSLIKYTDLKKHELIFVNDDSADRRIFTFLESIKKENIRVLHNDNNMGFSATVNKGIVSCEGDVILLNSDTIVTKNWIEKIITCAYSDEAIGTVTPLSNNATLCSVPNFCEKNSIPKGYTIDEFADLIERWSFKKYPTITVAHGFCMFIKRKVINDIGLFDVETFARGYGEENDFCFRAEQVGYHHVMCDDTFIYHKGTTSFLNEEKKKYIENNSKILEKRYKKQWVKNQKYCSIDREKEIRDNISIALRLRNERKNILYLVQADFREDASNNIGGTQLHVKDLTLGLKRIYNVFVAARDGEYLRLTAYIDDERISYKFFIGKPTDYYVFTDKMQKELYKNILNAFSIDIVHIHHTLDLTLDLYYEAKTLNIPLFATLHDFFYVCPSVKLINNKNELCINCETDKMCSECLKSQCSISETANFMQIWRRNNRKALQLCDKLIVPSRNTKEIFSLYYPELLDKIIVVEHGSDNFYEDNQLSKIELIITEKYKSNIEHALNNEFNFQLIAGWAYLEDIDSKDSKIFVYISDEFGNEKLLKANISVRDDVVALTKEKYLHSGFSVVVPSDYFKKGKLFIKTQILSNGKFFSDGNTKVVEYFKHGEKQGFHVAFIGGISPEKGSQLAYKIIKNSNRDINWYIFGGIGDADLYSINQENVVKTGWYRREELKTLIESHKIDLVCILPIWPETFCYTVSEALLCKIPVVVTDIGAVGDRVKEMNCGWTVSKDSSYKDIIEVINYIKDNPEEYQNKLNIVKNLKIKSISDMIQDYMQIYNQYVSIIINKNKFNSRIIYNGYLLENNTLDYTYQKVQEYSDRIKELKDELNSVYSSKVYKVFLILKNLNVPFKSQIKVILVKIYKILKRMKKN